MSTVSSSVRHTYRIFRSHLLQRAFQESNVVANLSDSYGVEVVGLFSTPTGLGESARLCAAALAKNGLPVRCRDVTDVFRKSKAIEWRPPNSTAQDKPCIRLFHLNPPMLPPAILAMGRKEFSRTFNIGYWAWELTKLPAEWQRALHYMNAIIVPSRFVQTTIAQYTSKPVEVVPHPVAVSPYRTSVRSTLGIPKGSFIATTVFNYSSSFERKNPVAVIQAFGLALADCDDAYLVLKASGGEVHQDKKMALAKAVGNSPRIMVFDETWPSDRVRGLIAESDVLISLHRAEGFGLTIAEAMSLRTPVIATGWSGNMDFCDAERNHLVRKTMVPVGKAGGPEFRGLTDAHWAEPDIGHAAELLSSIYENPAFARAQARESADHLNRYLSDRTYLTALRAISGDKSMNPEQARI